jgi:hypothetical protein
MIRFEPEMDVPHIWQSNERHRGDDYSLYCPLHDVFYKEKGVCTPSSHILTIVALWRSLLSADHSSQATQVNK